MLFELFVEDFSTTSGHAANFFLIPLDLDELFGVKNNGIPFLSHFGEIQQSLYGIEVIGIELMNDAQRAEGIARQIQFGLVQSGESLTEFDLALGVVHNLQVSFEQGRESGLIPLLLFQLGEGNKTILVLRILFSDNSLVTSDRPG